MYVLVRVSGIRTRHVQKNFGKKPQLEAGRKRVFFPHRGPNIHTCGGENTEGAHVNRRDIRETRSGVPGLQASATLTKKSLAWRVYLSFWYLTRTHQKQSWVFARRSCYSWEFAGCIVFWPRVNYSCLMVGCLLCFRKKKQKCLGQISLVVHICPSSILQYHAWRLHLSCGFQLLSSYALNVAWQAALVQIARVTWQWWSQRVVQQNAKTRGDQTRVQNLQTFPPLNSCLFSWFLMHLSLITGGSRLIPTWIIQIPR